MLYVVVLCVCVVWCCVCLYGVLLCICVLGVELHMYVIELWAVVVTYKSSCIILQCRLCQDMV